VPAAGRQDDSERRDGPRHLHSGKFALLDVYSKLIRLEGLLTGFAQAGAMEGGSGEQLDRALYSLSVA
jgi:hypothetical protein